VCWHAGFGSAVAPFFEAGTSDSEVRLAIAVLSLLPNDTCDILGYFYFLPHNCFEYRTSMTAGISSLTITPVRLQHPAAMFSVMSCTLCNFDSTL
jgi:hypothetical protein